MCLDPNFIILFTAVLLQSKTKQNKKPGISIAALANEIELFFQLLNMSVVGLRSRYILTNVNKIQYMVGPDNLISFANKNILNLKKEHENGHVSI